MTREERSTMLVGARARPSVLTAALMMVVGVAIFAGGIFFGVRVVGKRDGKPAPCPPCQAAAAPGGAPRPITTPPATGDVKPVPVEDPAKPPASAPSAGTKTPTPPSKPGGKPCKLGVASIPSNASITLDGKPAGVTPMLRHLPCGQQMTVVVSKAGWRSRVVAFTLDGDRVFTVGLQRSASEPAAPEPTAPAPKAERRPAHDEDLKDPFTTY
jgi:hypothetical protein